MAYTVIDNKFNPDHCIDQNLKYSFQYFETSSYPINSWENLKHNPLCIFTGPKFYSHNLIKYILDRPLKILLYELQLKELLILIEVAKRSSKKMTIYIRNEFLIKSGSLETCFDTETAKLYLLSEFITSVSGIKPDIFFLKSYDDKVDTFIALTGDEHAYHLANNHVVLDGIVCFASGIYRRKCMIADYRLYLRNNLSSGENEYDIQKTISDMDQTLFYEMFMCIYDYSELFTIIHDFFSDQFHRFFTGSHIFG